KKRIGERIEEASERKIGPEEKVEYSKYLLKHLLPVLKQINQEQVAEKQVEATIRGTAALLEDLLQNIQRRVYDALNVLMAERAGLRSRIEKKAAYLQELEEQFVGLQNLIQRNQELCASGNVITDGVSLPFILVQICPHATVEEEISEDMQLVHFDFNSTPFELHDDNYVLNLMNWSDDANCDVVETGGGEGCMMVDTQCHSTYLDTQCHGY
ncbi:hypothetical protein MKW92_033011, partial [Papaver armeniacum]